MKKFKISFVLTLLTFIIPFNVLAYSDYIIAGGENIGIEIKTDGVMIVGMYEIDGTYPALTAGIKVGDSIIKVNDKNISSIDELVKEISNYKDNVELTLKRDNKTYQTNLNIKLEDGISKTGLYVKDNITGIGTLSYMAPEMLKEKYNRE